MQYAKILHIVHFIKSIMASTTEIIDCILLELEKRHSNCQINIEILKVNHNLEVDKTELRNANDAILAKGIAESSQTFSARNYAYNITDFGLSIIEEHGSYSAYLESKSEKKQIEETERKSHTLEKKFSRTTTIIGLTLTGIFGISTFVLGYYTFRLDRDKEKLEDRLEVQQKEIKIKQQQIDSLLTIINH